MLRRYPALGSTKTYRRVTKGDTSSLILPAQIEKYRGVWRQIEEGSGDNGPEEIYTDLTPAFETARAAALLIPQHGRERLMLIEGPTGSGKTMSLANIARRYPSTTVLADASTAWKNPNCMVGDILIAAGVYTDPAEDETSKLPVRYADRLAALKSHFRAKRKILLIDEGHHMAAESLNVLKGLLNDSDLLIIVACIDTLWRKLASAAWAEASQLVLNRMFERVRLMPPAPEDAEMYLSRRVPALAESGDGWKAALGTVTAAAKSYGSFAFLRRLAKRLNQKDAITREKVAGEVESLVKALRTRNSNPADS
jgi:Rad3-related DNA helicase